MAEAPPSLKYNILVAPLDWGLGHATRCIPLIRALQNHNCGVILAGEGNIQQLLKAEFGEIPFLHLEGYRVRYSKKKWSLPFVIGSQIPKIIGSIKKEHEWLQQAAIQHNIHGIISDNRYGMWHPSLPAVFMTHQLSIQTGLGNNADAFLQQLNYNHINRFTQCWVPDVPHLPNLGGKLSHPSLLPSIPVRYIGPLSRFQQKGSEAGSHILILLSGPEPQRTLLEAIILAQVPYVKEEIILLRGLPGVTALPKVPGHVKVFNHLPSRDLQQYMGSASRVTSRCGYSTVMDLAVLGKKSILIPTPGQTEQEYLARHLMKHNRSLCIQQSHFNLKAALHLSRSFPYDLDTAYSSYLDAAVNGFMEQLKTNTKKP